MAETQGTTTPTLTDIQKLENGSASLSAIDKDLFSAEIKAIDTKKSALETKQEVQSWFTKHKQDIANGVFLVALAYIIFRLTA